MNHPLQNVSRSWLRVLRSALALGACAAAVLAGSACSALIDEELSGKTSPGEPAGSAGESGGGGAGGGGAAGGGTTPTTTTSTGPCPAGCSLQHAMASCVDDVCEIADCHPGFADCNHGREDGCEVDLSEDSESCGKCGKDCHADEQCEEGKCK